MGIGTDSIDNALTVSGNISARDTVIADSLSARYLGLVHIPAGDGIDPSIRMGETDTTGFSGVFISYNESTNVFGISSLFSPAPAVDCVSINRFGNVGIANTASAEKLTVSGNVSALSAVYHIGNPPGTIPVYLTIRNINALASTGTRTVGYNVPTGKRFLANSYSFVVTNTDQSSAFAVAPSISITNGSTNKLANDLTFSSGLTAPSYGIGNISSSGGSFGSGNTLRHTSTDTVGVSIVTPAYGGGTQTVFTGDVVIVGSLIDL
jgi:hypothetical protein